MVGRKMNNEPVAWMGKDYDGIKTDLYFDVERNKLPYRLYESAIPLYTHPVKKQDCYGDGNVYRGVRSKDSEIKTVYFNPVKELTDEEIWELHQEHIDEVTCGHSMKTVGFIEFARAILRKAQEK
jgi:hypothetical protein